MADEAVDIGEKQPLFREEFIGDPPQLRLNEPRDIAREDRSEPVIGDLLPHDVEAVWPRVLAGRDDRRPSVAILMATA